MFKKVLFASVVLAVAACPALYAIELQSILNTGDQATYIDTVKLKRTARPAVAIPTQGFGGDAGVEDTFSFGPQSWPNEYIEISYIVGVARMTPFRINSPVENEWYDLPTPVPMLVAPKVKFLDVDGVAEERGSAPASPPVTVTPSLFQRRSTLRFETASPGRCVVQVLDAAGRVVRRLVDQDLQAGMHECSWDRRLESGETAPSGVYLAHVVAGNTGSLVKLVATD